MGVSWVYRLSKLQLQAELRKHSLDTSGNLDVLRQRMVSFVRHNETLFANKPDDPKDFDEEEFKFADRQAIDVTPPTTQPNDNTRYIYVEPTTPAAVKTLEAMRKWNCPFDGTKLYEFLERVEELQTAYQFSDEHMIQGLPELLRGNAQLWYRNIPQEEKTWPNIKAHMRAYFLSPTETRNLDRQINDRKQGTREPIRDFATVILTLIRRRGGFDTDRTIDAIYYNMRTEFRLHINRRDITSTNQLIQRVEEINETLQQLNRDLPARSISMATTKPYNRNECCWRCKQRGHRRQECKNKYVKFCSFCGKDNILSRDCNCTKPENGERAEANSGYRPKETTGTRSQ